MRFLIFAVTITPLGCTWGSDGDVHRKFFDCWQIRRTGVEQYGLNFEAVVFPRVGVIAYNTACPELSLNMQFHDLAETPLFDPFRRADADPLALVGIRGRGVVTIPETQDDPNTLTVRVSHVIDAVILNESETRRLAEAMTR